ncbi:uncharacterized protein isoform X1 [Choristoneura fumiferana]|uniref:uncharacterized protein isoform X1 n=1 Tax=Choristoneura fumiferana TaxID=7141 RepID=UPI003D155CE6
MDLKLACLLVFLLGLFLQAEAEYLWHNDEIPYDPDAKCKRGFSYYSNSMAANDTDIDVGTDVESLLDYSNTSICFFCVCSVSGNGAGCIARDKIFCQFYRDARAKDYARDVYTGLFQQDRPAYFRHLSYRMRRTMDMGITDYVEMANQGLVTPSCIPYLSEYNDCNGRTDCRGCNKCTCNAHGQWTCYNAFNSCETEYQYGITSVDDDSMDQAINALVHDVANLKEREKQSKQNKQKIFVPAPPKPTKPTTPAPNVLAFEYFEKQYDDFIRSKRSAAPHNETKAGVKFYHVVDEMNEDTLKNSNISGTLAVKKMDLNTGKASRRSGVLHNTSQNPLHIQYNDPKIYNHHIADNKIDSPHTEDKYDALSHEKLHKLISNFTNKDKDLSKVVVNELKSGSETVGDKKGPVMSNITFTPENDTLTAMAFIAGNLLNKLWNLEKEASDDSIETEVMKHQKIAELLELFKEPMTYRQEQFLKDALEKLSDALNKNKDIKNVSLCETVEELQKNMNDSAEVNNVKSCDSKNNTVNGTEKQNHIILDALSKMNDVLVLLKKFEDVQKNLHVLKHPEEKPHLRSYLDPKSTPTEDEVGTMNLFGNILNKLTNLLIPNRNNNIKGKIRNENILSNTPNLNKQLKKKFNIDFDGTKLTDKDKMVLDYINKMQTNACFSSLMAKEDKSVQNAESNILLNLSEFFKIKSMSDLIQLVNSERNHHTTTTTTLPPTTTSTNEPESSRALNSGVTKEIKFRSSNKTMTLKERLRIHLRTIFNDLIEIQKERGGTLKPGDLNIAEALPCLFNMLNEDKSPAKPKKYSRDDLVNKVKSVLETVRRETKNLPPNRRFNINSGPRPKSAVVWERLVKNLDYKRKASRRNIISEEPISYEAVKKSMDKLESESSNTYKSYAFRYEVPAADKLVFLKTLNLDTTHYINVLEKLQILNDDSKLPIAQLDDIKEFVDNAAENINLNERIVNSFNKQKQKRFKIEKNKIPLDKVPVVTSLSNLNEHVIKTNDKVRASADNNFKLSRDQVLNQLIKNRVELYLRLKEAQDIDLSGDMKYNIARRIVTNLENGNYDLARELFKIFVNNQRQMENYAVLPTSSQKSRLKNQLEGKIPLIHFEKTQVQPWVTQDNLLKQLLNMRNMK